MEVTAAERNITYTEAQSLAQKINNYILTNRSSIANVAKAIGYSRTTVSRYLAGKYDSDPTDLENKLAEFLAHETGEAVEVSAPAQEPGAKTGQTPVFYESRDAKAVLGVCQSCQEYIGLGIVVARSGYGKTYALRQYAKLPRVAYIECDDTMSSRDLVEAIERSLGLPSGYGTIWRRVNGIREFFNTNRGYLLIIDEADKLVSKHTQKKMEILRAVFDQSDVGLVIAGEPKLEAQMARKRVIEAPSLKSWEDVNDALRQIAEAQIAVGDIESDMQKQIIGAQKVAEEQCKPYKDSIARLEREIKTFVTDHRDEMGKAKSMTLTFGEVGFRLSTSVSLPPREGEAGGDHPPPQVPADDRLHRGRGEDQQGGPQEIRGGHGERGRGRLEAEGRLRLRGKHRQAGADQGGQLRKGAQEWQQQEQGESSPPSERSGRSRSRRS